MTPVYKLHGRFVTGANFRSYRGSKHAFQEVYRDSKLDSCYKFRVGSEHQPVRSRCDKLQQCYPDNGQHEQ